MPVTERYRNLAADRDARGGAGGDTIVLKSASALKIGDVVYVSASKTVAKSTIQADYQKFAGVVVGGGSDFGMDPAIFDTGSVGLTAVAAAAKSAVVQINGIANVVAGAAIAVGDKVTGDTGTAGRVLSGAGAIAGQIIGQAITAAVAAGDVIQILIQRH